MWYFLVFCGILVVFMWFLLLCLLALYFPTCDYRKANRTGGWVGGRPYTMDLKFRKNQVNQWVTENEMTKPKLGSGARFKSLTKKLSKKGVSDPKALAASIGRKKFGAKKFNSLAAKGK